MKELIGNKKNQICLFFTVIAALILRIALRDFVSRDMSVCLLPWYDEISALSFKEALTTQVGNYNFLYQLLIFILTRIPGEPIYKYKILSVLFDYVLAFGVYAFAKKTLDEKKAVLGFAVTLLLPTVCMNSAWWGQCDSMYVSVIIWSLYFLYSDKIPVSFAFLGLALALKLQTVFILPFYFFVFVTGILEKKKKIEFYHFGLIPITMLATALPNILAGRPVTDMIAIYKDQTEKYEVISFNYQSIWNLFHLSYDTDSKWCIGFTCIVLIALMVFFYMKKADITGRHFIWCAFLLTYTCVLFLPSMHERYGYLYEILVVILALSYGINWITVVLFQFISSKTYVSYLNESYLDTTFVSLLNTALYIFVLYVFYRELSGKPLSLNLFSHSEAVDDTVHEFRKERIVPGKKDIIAMLALTGIFLIIGSFHLGKAKAPETYTAFGTATQQGPEIYVSLDAIRPVGSVCIYPMMSGSEGFELYYAENDEWKKIDEELTLKGVFTWRRIDVDVSTHQFCIIFSDPKVQIGEVVCLAPDGQRIDLMEDSQPFEIFDEQDTLSSFPTSADSMIFDEVYHGRTAYEFLKGMTIYENTHPPLGKTLISIGIRMFGMNPFGYRIIVLIFGMMCIPVMYLLALNITGDSRYAILAGVLQITEFMHYTLSRIATIDIIVAFFVICMFYGVAAFLRDEKYRYLVFSGAAFALGIATKWTAAYAAAGIALILFAWMIGKIRKKSKAPYIVKFVLICIGSFIVFPAIVYVLSYIPFAKAYQNKNLIEHAISNSIHMLEYHRNVTAPHPYASPWYSWVVDWLPLVDFRMTVGNYKSTVSTFVNPFVCWAGLLSVFHHVYMAFKKKDAVSALLVVFYVSMLLPWVFITRTVFIYQYFICTKVLVLMICRSIQCIGFKNENRVIKFTAAVSIALFIAFFPVISGVMANVKYIDGVLRMLPCWWF